MTKVLPLFLLLLASALTPSAFAGGSPASAFVGAKSGPIIYGPIPGKPGSASEDCRSYWLDRDGDSWGDPAVERVFCGGAPANFATRPNDCNDYNRQVCPAPGCYERCNGYDNDCDGQIDEDSDGDGYDACEEYEEGCSNHQGDSYPGVDADGDGFTCDEECSQGGDANPLEYPGNDYLTLSCAPR